MIDGKFTAKERAYLASLPAVKSVSPSHIRYTDRFKVEVMCRYNAGESPSAIFREAGLDPKLIGYKRVERCIARWKQQERDERRKGKGAMNHYLQDVEDDLSIAELQGAAHEEETDGLTSADESQDMAAKLAQAQLTINKCDLLIAKQALRIDELERVLRKFIQWRTCGNSRRSAIGNRPSKRRSTLPMRCGSGAGIAGKSLPCGWLRRC